MKALKNNKKRKLQILCSISALLAVVLVIIYFSNINKSQAGVDQDKTDLIKGETVNALVRKNLASGLILAGKVTANNDSAIKIDPEKGTIKEVHVKEGDFVEKGQALFTYQTDQEIATKEADLNVEVQSRALEVARSTSNINWETYNKKVKELEQARINYNKEKTEELKNMINTIQSEVNQAYLEGIAGDNAVKDAESELKKAEFTKNSEQEKLKQDTVVADNDGYIKTLNMDLVNQSRERKSEENFIEIIDESSLFVNGDINEFDREKISVNQPVELIDRNNTENKWKGKIVQVGNLTSDEADDESQQNENPNLSKFPYKVLVNEEDQMPIIGSHVLVNVLEESFEEGQIILDNEYVFSQEDKQFVWKVEENKIVLHEVTAEPAGENLINIKEGLDWDDEIVLPKEGLEEGMEVDENTNP